jgi:hypothetical protein
MSRASSRVLYYSQGTIKELNYTTFHLPTSAEANLLSMLHEPTVPPYALSQKIGCIASIMRNFSIEGALVKNVRVQVVGLLPNMVQVQLRAPLSHQADSIFYLPASPLNLSRSAQIGPSSVAVPFAPSICHPLNRCQGLTLDRVVLDLTVPVIAHSQPYTSLSRIRAAACICIIGNQII